MGCQILAYMFTLFSLISEGLGGVSCLEDGIATKKSYNNDETQTKASVYL